MFFPLCFSHLGIFCFLFCRKLQSNLFFLSGNHHNRFIIPNHFHKSKWFSVSNNHYCFSPGFGILQVSQYLVNLCTLGRYLQNHQPECVSCTEIVFPLWQQDKLVSNRGSCICNIQWKSILLTFDIPWQCYGMYLVLVNLMHFITLSIIKAFSHSSAFLNIKVQVLFEEFTKRDGGEVFYALQLVGHKPNYLICFSVKRHILQVLMGQLLSAHVSHLMFQVFSASLPAPVCVVAGRC